MRAFRWALAWGVACGALVLALQTGCGSPRRGEPIAGTFKAKTPELERGRIAFARHCHSCHPGGEGGLGPALNNKPLPTFLVRFQVRHGLGAMPSFDREHIPTDELDDLLQYVVALRRHESASGR